MTITTIKPAAAAMLAGTGSLLGLLFGPWDLALQTLLLFMAVDFFTGLLVAGVFHSSAKSTSGALESRAGWKGLGRKGVTLLMVLVAHRLDFWAGTSFIRSGVISAYVAVEAISITENAGLMGVPIPQVIVNAIDALRP